MGRSGIDLSQIASKALATAPQDEQAPAPPRQGAPGKAQAAGAALLVAARTAVKHAPGLPNLGHLAELPDQLRDRLADHGWLGEDDADHDDEPEAEYDDDEDLD